MATPSPEAGDTPSPTASLADSGDASKAPQAGTDAHDADELTPAQYKAIIADLRKEQGANRTKIATFEKAQADAEAAKLSDLEKANKKAADLEAQLNERTRASQERIINYEIRLNASSLGIVDPDAAVKLLDWSKLKYDDDGIPTNAAELVQALAKDKPYLVAPANQRITSGGATKPASSSSAASTDLSWDTIPRMKPDEYEARRAEIVAWMAKNPLRR
jgi:hypothetical protein